MITAALNTLSCQGIERSLWHHLRADQIALTPTQVDCGLEDGVLIVILHFDKAPALESTATFAATRDFLAQSELTKHYSHQIYLVVEQKTALRDSDVSAILPQFTAAIPRLTGTSQTIPLLPSQGPLFPFGRIFPTLRYAWASRGRAWGKWLGILLGGGILTLAGYGLTRPCVLSGCPQLVQAQQQVQALPLPPPQALAGEWLTLTRGLEQALEMLAVIPPWSPFFLRAEDLRHNYQQRLKDLEVLHRAAHLAQLAQEEKEPQQSRELWYQGLLSLTQIPTDSDFRALVLARAQTYQAQLQRLDQHLLQEQKAGLALQQAQRAITTARQKSGSLKTLGQVDLAIAAQKKAIYALENIPTQTQAHQKGQQQLGSQHLELKHLQELHRRESQAQLAFSQAQKSAQLGMQANKRQQQSQALLHWRAAIAALKKIPPQSWLAASSRKLLQSYESQRQQTRQKLAQAVRKQTLQKNLAQFCRPQGSYCTYKIEEKKIKLFFNATYLQQLWNSTLEARAKGNLKDQTQILNHIAHLEKFLQALSHQAQLPVEAFNSKGKLLARYNP